MTGTPALDPVGLAYETILSATGLDLNGELGETPGRAAKAWHELTSGYSCDIPAIFKTFDANGYDEMVVVRDIPFSSLCEHHLLPFYGKAAVAYIPDGRIVGLSKLARLVDAFARRLQVQERLANEVVDALMEHLQPTGAAVVMQAEHLCMSIRGARVPGSTTVTSALRGAMFAKPEARAEVLSLLR